MAMGGWAVVPAHLFHSLLPSPFPHHLHLPSTYTYKQTCLPLPFSFPSLLLLCPSLSLTCIYRPSPLPASPPFSCHTIPHLPTPFHTTTYLPSFAPTPFPLLPTTTMAWDRNIGPCHSLLLPPFLPFLPLPSPFPPVTFSAAVSMLNFCDFILSNHFCVFAHTARSCTCHFPCLGWWWLCQLGLAVGLFWSLFSSHLPFSL